MASTSISRKYTNISFESVREHLLTIMKAKGGNLADYSESSYGRLMTDLFAGTSDLMAYYAESSFKNAFLESANSLPSIYANARMLGYSIRRPVPAKAGIGIQTTKTGKFNTIRVRIPLGTEFTMGSTTLTAMDNMEFRYDRNTDTEQTGLMTLVSGKAVLAEGRFKTESLISTGNQNQTFIIHDLTFSDYFGDNDPNFDDDGNVAHRSSAFTRVMSDATLMDNIDPSVVVDDKLYWRISRRGLIDPAKESVLNDIEQFASGQDNYTDNYTVELSTANDGNVQLRFGDGLKSAIPYGVINVTYFSTTGEEGNLLNVAGTTLSTNSSRIVICQDDGTESDITVNDLNIAITTDIRNGLDIESIESIKANAPYLFNTLDRLVNRTSYKIFLRRYSDVKYATAYGEDILNTKLLNGGIDVKYMNQVRFSALKSLYRQKDNTFYPTTADEYFLEGYKVNGLMYTWQYDYRELERNGLDEGHIAIYKRLGDALQNIRLENGEKLSNEVQQQILQSIQPTYPLDYQVYSALLSPLDFVEDGSELYNCMTALNQRGMITVGGGYHNYVYPSVHDMEAHMKVTLFRGNNFTDVKERIKNAVYKYLLENTDFATPIYRSRIEAIVHTLTEVAGVDVTFSPVNDRYVELDINDLRWLGQMTYEYIVPGNIALDGFDFSLGYTYVGDHAKKTYQNTFTVQSLAALQTRIADYYKYTVRPKLASNATNKLSDLDIDKFVAYIWEQAMMVIYTTVHKALLDEQSAGQANEADALYYVIQAIKGWDKGYDSLTFKNTDKIVDMSEIEGNSLHDYIEYALEYIKLVRNVLKYYVTKNLIDDAGNITNYSNDNEIVQITIPTDQIELAVSVESVLLTE